MCERLKGEFPAPNCCKLSLLAPQPSPKALLGLETSHRERRGPSSGQDLGIPLRGPPNPCPRTHFAEGKAEIRGAAAGRPDAQAPFRSSPVGRRKLRGPFLRMTPDSFERHPKPGEAPTGRAWGRAARCNDRAHGLWMAAAEEAGGIRLFLAGARPLAPARVGPAAGRPPRPPRSPRGGGERRGLAGPGGGAVSRAHLRSPPTGVLSGPSTALGSDPRPPAQSPRACVPRRPLPLRRPSGMDSGRDFLTLHGEFLAGVRADLAPADPARSRSRALGRGPPGSFGRPPPRPGPVSRLFCCIGEISAQDSRGGTARQDLGLVPQIWPEVGGGCGSEDFPKGEPRPPDSASRILPFSGLRRLGSVVQRARKGRGGTEPASTNNQVLPTPSGPRWRGSPKPRLPGPRQAAWVWQGGCGGGRRRGGVQGWPRLGWAAVTAQRRNPCQRCPRWKERPDPPIRAPSWRNQAECHLELPAAPPFVQLVLSL